MKRKDKQKHLDVSCEGFPVPCEASSCRVKTPRGKIFEHLSVCTEIKEICDVCDQLVKRKYMDLHESGDYTHDCLAYLKMKANNSKQKASYLKEAAKY